MNQENVYRKFQKNYGQNDTQFGAYQGNGSINLSKLIDKFTDFNLIQYICRSLPFTHTKLSERLARCKEKGIITTKYIKNITFT